VKKIKKLFQSISRLYEKRFLLDFQSLSFSSQLNVDETVKECLMGLYSILYVDLSSHDAQKYLASTSFSFHSSSTILCINLLPLQVVHGTGNDSTLVHNLLFKLSLKESKSELSGFGNSQSLPFSLDKFSNSLIVS
jgi:hypothetical protein